MDAYEKQLIRQDIFLKLKEAEYETEHTDIRYSHEEVFGDLRRKIKDL